jgi:3,4-dihydroxy 2-butanone 4-phosphate synthase/GTP cyclohydrolase II
MSHASPLAPIPEILDDLRSGRVIVLVDDENRENEGDFVVAAESLDVETLNFITRVGNGYLCVAMDGASCDRLDLAPAVATNTSLRGTAFTVSVDGHPRHGVGTGISARDRVKTIRMLADPDSRPDDFVRPGHVNPLRARDGGTLVRTGQTEGSVDLCRLAGLLPAAVIIEIVRPDGEMARMPDLEKLCAEHGIRMCSVEQVIEHRLQRETLVKRLNPVEGTPIETPEGRFDLFAWSSAIDPTSRRRRQDRRDRRTHARPDAPPRPARRRLRCRRRSRSPERRFAAGILAGLAAGGQGGPGLSPARSGRR